jgi:hypothetical protein
MNLNNILVFQLLVKNPELLAWKFSALAPDSRELKLSNEVSMNMLANRL